MIISSKFLRYVDAPKLTFLDIKKGIGSHAKPPAGVLPASYAALWLGIGRDSSPKTKLDKSSPAS